MESDKGKQPAPYNGGKGKAPSKPENSSTDPSLLSRVAASASGLTRSAFTAPNSNEISQTANSALSNSGKGSSTVGSGSGSSAWAESSKATQQPGTSQLNKASREGFRVGHSEEHAHQSENEFSSFLDGIPPFESSPPQVPAPGGDKSDLWEEAWGRSHVQARYTTVEEQQSRDGEEVLAMLSVPSSTSEQFEAPEPEEENYDWGLSKDQITQLRAMTKHMFPAPPSHAGIDPNHPLNLNPNVETENSHQSNQGVDPEAREALREQWEGVLTRYTDEVWGGLLPLVKEARQEVEDMGNNAAGTEQPTALRRLGAILGHLKQR
ncbi:hypothetical protein LSUE1_G003890 [Lachnellula suecica]|uniref:Uncharacterized protein n=1 Tax=Lachnellula suecica TaxID=602035 RepID=A0A8T9C2L3_9HELO|nr:hypothetical protein LSUE1_G003890 [Lachnellula suecica]